MSSSEHQTNDREVALFHTISDTEKHKSDNNKEIRLAEISMSERTAKIEIENKAHNLEQEKDFRLTNTKRLYWMLILIILLLIGFIIAMTALGHKDIIIPVFLTEGSW
jgi:cell division protein FtsL